MEEIIQGVQYNAVGGFTPLDVEEKLKLWFHPTFSGVEDVSHNVAAKFNNFLS